ncbi:hypothetical protein [Microbacterium aquilitoris]|uniref:hypothetical protein n=1 Tax=Microbacterium aquilitoris TaxID=3067307 RepID=UPI0028937908|nr:hypothetical protein [Microbacterium sp. KSW2-22]
MLIKKVRGGQPPRVARENGRVKIQVLHIEDCPNWQEAGDRVRLVLDSIGRGDVPVEFVLIRTGAEAVSSGFAGSPTILLDGQDLFPSQGNTADLACRVYLTERGFAGAPTVGQLERTLQEREALSGDRS